MPSAEVSITQTGRGGGIHYREGRHSIPFDWEFAMSPALALIWGPKAAQWDARFPWAAGRQAQIYDFVGAEVVRQKASGSHFTYDLDAGTMDILEGRTPPIARPAGAAPRKRSEAYERFLESVIPVWQNWEESQHYDVAALAELDHEELPDAAALLTGRDITWREVDALAAIDLPVARSAVQAALTHHLSIDARLAAAEALHRADPGFDLETLLARQIRALNRPAEGLRRALRLAAAHPTPMIQQALLWSSYNCTDCAPACAELLLTLKGVVSPPLDAETGALLTDLGYHNSSFTRSAAFATLCQRVGMQLDHDAAN
ncbi:MAG: hypothetical protein ABI742_14485 [Gemmatimonadota bacterium]